MSHVDIKPGAFVRSMCALTTAALIWSQAAQVQAAESQTLVDKLPPEIKTIIDNAEDIAAVYSGISGTIDAARVIADMLGILKKFDQAEEFRKLHEHLDQLGAALDWKLNVDNQDRRLAKVLATVYTAETAVKLGMPFNLATDGVSASLDAVIEAGSEDQFRRYYRASATDGKWKEIILDRPEVNSANYVSDWRLGVPALMQLISLRVIIVAAIDPNFTNDMAFRTELLQHRHALLAQYRRMIDGVRCNWSFRQPSYSEFVIVRAACADFYTGTSAISAYIERALFRPSLVFNECPLGGYPPFRIGELGLGGESPASKQCLDKLMTDEKWANFINTTIKQTNEDLRRQVLLKMPLFEMRSMIDTLYLYANGGPDLTKAQELIQVAAAPNLCLDVQWGNPTPGTPVWLWGCDGDHAQRWVYKRHAENVEERGTIRNPVYDKCLDVRGVNPAPGTPVQIWDCDGGLAQKWTYDPETQVLQNALGTVLSTQCQIQFQVRREHWGIPVPAFECGPPQAQTPVWTWGRNEGPAQRWKTPPFSSLGDGLLDQVDAPLHKGEWPRRIDE